MDPLEDAAGSSFVRLTGSCTVPESSEVRESSGGLLHYDPSSVLAVWLEGVIGGRLHPTKMDRIYP